tara:strand:+ start:520 stop:1179 length:660 start_codon:yes stop_codon:yes gene_type:complete
MTNTEILFESIDKIRDTRIKMLEGKMKWFIDGVGRSNETFENFFKRKYGPKTQGAKDNSAVEMTKALALLDDKVMEEIALTGVGKSINLSLEFGDGFDMIIKGIDVEKKNTASKDKATAAVGNKFSHNKVDNHWITRYTPSGNRISELWDGLIDLGEVSHPLSGWVGADGNNAGFSKFQVHNSDAHCIKIFHGSINSGSQSGKKFVHFINESVNPSVYF